MELKYHQATYDLLKQQPVISASQIQFLDDLERQFGITLPASVREWYSLQGAFEIIDRYTMCEMVKQLDWLINEKNYPEFIAGLAENKLLVIQENYSVYNWFVPLNDSNDPPVLAAMYNRIGNSVKYKHHIDKFSQFIYTRIWDCKWFDANWVLYSLEEPISPDTLSFLKKNFTEELQSLILPTDVSFRFYDGSKCILIQSDEEFISDENEVNYQGEWYLWADSEKEILELARTVLGCGNLSKTLEAHIWNGEDVWGLDTIDVLQILESE